MRLAKLAYGLALVAAVCVGQGAVSAPKKRVLLAWEKTRFKQALIEEMAKQLEAQGYAVTRAMHSKKGLAQKAADYDAVFITNSGVYSKVRPWITKWLEANKAHAARILLHTTQTSDWKVEAKVDAVTSASKKADVKRMAADYVARLVKKMQAGAGK